MDERNTGIHRVLSSPWGYRAYQRVIGARRLHRAVIACLQLEDRSRLLDIGCGPAEVLDVLIGHEYVGFDVSAVYIAHAKRRYKERGTFFVADITDVDVGPLGPFDRALAHGLLHHLSDDLAAQVFTVARDALEPSGRLVTVDGCFAPHQTRASRFLVDRDRGQMIRTPDEYAALAETAFEQVDVRVDHSLLRVPYTLAILTCERPRTASSATRTAAQTAPAASAAPAAPAAPTQTTLR